VLCPGAIEVMGPRDVRSPVAPVIGGLSTDEVFFLFNLLAQSGRTIVGFDLNEVSSGEEEFSEWDGNVGARILYKLCGWTTLTNK